MLFRVAVVLQLLLFCLHSYTAAQTLERLYPESASAELSVTGLPEKEQAAHLLAESAESHGIGVAQVRISETSQGTRRDILVLTDNEGTPQATAGGGAYPDFGTALDTRVSRFDAGADAVLGRWAAYGDRASVQELAQVLRQQGFELEATERDLGSAWGLLSYDRHLLTVELGGFVMLFTAALLSASRATKSRAVRMLHGRRAPYPGIREFARYGAYIVGSLLAVVAVWLLCSWLLWDSGQVFHAPGLLVLGATAAAAAAACLLSGLALLVVMGVNANLVDQFAGKRPLGLILVAGAVAGALVLTGVLTSWQRTADRVDRMNTAAASAELWQGEPEIYATPIFGAEEAEFQESRPAWKRLADDVSSSGRLLLSFPERRCSLSPTQRPCLFVNESYLDRAGVLGRDGERIAPLDLTPSEVGVIIPEGLSAERSRIEEEVRDWSGFQREMVAQECSSSKLPSCSALDRDTRVESWSSASGQTLPVFHGKPLTALEGTAMSDPVLIVVPDGGLVPSGDFHGAMASQGNELFMVPRGELEERIADLGLDPLVTALDKPGHTAERQVAEARLRLAENVVILVVGLVAAVVLTWVLVGIYCERRRRPLFVLHLHGARFGRRYAGYFATFSTVAAVAVLASSGVSADVLSPPFVAGATTILALGLLSVPALRINDRRFRADFIKRS